MIEIFIPGNTPSLKNSKVATASGVFASPTVTRYLRSLGIQSFSSSRKTIKEYVADDRPNLFRKLFDDIKWVKPTEVKVVGFHFVRRTRHKFDFGNACQIVQDLLVAHDFFEDDDMTHLIPMPFQMNDAWYTYDKENPGVFVRFY